MVINLDSVNATLSNVSFKRILIRYNQEDPPTPSGGIWTRVRHTHGPENRHITAEAY